MIIGIIDGDTKAQRGKAICPRPHSNEVVGIEFDLSICLFQSLGPSFPVAPCNLSGACYGSFVTAKYGISETPEWGVNLGNIHFRGCDGEKSHSQSMPCAQLDSQQAHALLPLQQGQSLCGPLSCSHPSQEVMATTHS